MTDALTLIYALPSPFVRKAVIVAAEAGIMLDRKDATASPIATNPDLEKINPLGKVPALILPSGDVLYDSPVICRYLGDGTPLYPTDTAGWRALRREALADGLIDAALLLRYETTLRPEALRWVDWMDGQMAKIHQALRVMAQEAEIVSGFDIGDVATGCALGYLDFRYPDLDWRSRHPALAIYAETLFGRTSFIESAPA